MDKYRKYRNIGPIVKMWKLPGVLKAYNSIPRKERCSNYRELFFYVLHEVLLTWESSDHHYADRQLDWTIIPRYFNDQERDSGDTSQDEDC